MTEALLPWFLFMLLIGIVIGLIVGIVIASTLVRGHYTHFINHSQPLPPFYEEGAARQQFPRNRM